MPRILLIIAISILAQTAHASHCLSYEPDSNTLTGTIRRTTFPGPPNYASIQHGDRPETYWLLHLDRAVCVEPGKQDDLNDPERDITSMQLVIFGGYAQYKKFLDKQVIITGKLSHAISGHHHTRVLIEVETMRDAVPTTQRQ